MNASSEHMSQSTARAATAEAVSKFLGEALDLLKGDDEAVARICIEVQR